MKKRVPKKLILGRETLLNLAPTTIAAAGSLGGSCFVTCVAECYPTIERDESVGCSNCNC